MPDDKPTYRLTLRPEGAGPPPEQRLRAVLKRVLRWCQMRCILVEEVLPEPPTTEPKEREI